MIDVRLGGAPPDAHPGVDDSEASKRTPADLRRRGGELGRALAPGTTVFSRPGLRGSGLTAFVEGLLLGSYRYTHGTDRHDAPTVVHLTGPTDEAALERARLNAAATAWTRDLANTPANIMTPDWLSRAVSRRLTVAGCSVEVRDEAWLAAQGFGGVLAVGGGSSAPPRLVEARWRPHGARTGRHVVIVGKGITFDTGGLNIKPGDSMRGMKTDMAGGAASVAALELIARLELPIAVTVLVPCAENAFGGAAYRPSDVVRHYGGRTSEITNTDAEGRIVLADALAYAVATMKPTTLIDIATLTGAMKVALGSHTAGFFASSDALARSLSTAGDAAGELLWRMPLVEEYESLLASTIADADQAPGNPGAITAALFLRHFTGGLPWAHLDIAGPARAVSDDGIVSAGATGFGARVLATWVEAQA